jgi:hypothetical protein
MNRAIWSAEHSPLRLAHHTDNSHPWSGLASVSLHLSPHLALGNLTLEVAFDPNPNPVFSKTFDRRTSSVRFCIPTHLLPDGPGRLTFTARQACRAWTLRVPFIVSNPSFFASKVRENLRRLQMPLVSTRRIRALV